MIYEDFIYLWLALIFYEFVPTGSGEISLFLFLIKEFLFVFFLLIIRKKHHLYKLNIIPVLEKIFVVFAFIFYIIDLSFFKLKFYLNKVYFSSLFAIFWFLHYLFLIKFLLFKFSLNYLKIVLGIIFPIFVLIFFQDLFSTLRITFPGDIFLFLILIFFISPFFIIKIWPVKPMKNEELEQIILEFFQKNKIKINQIYVLDDLGKKVYTAGILGFLYPFRYLFFSKPILEIMSIEEILGIVAHEIGHIKKKHNFWLLLILANLPLYLLTFSIFAFLIIYWFYPEYIKIFENKSTLPFKAEFLFGMGIIFLSFIYIRYIFTFFLRQFEREADFFSAVTLKTTQPLISALSKVGQITGQFYKKSWHHYGIFERINFLEEVFNDIEKFKKTKKKFVKIRLWLVLWIFLNLVINGIVLYNEEIVKFLTQLFSL